MTSFSIVPLLVTLLAPSPAEPTPEATAPTDAEPEAVAPAATAPEAAAPEAAAPATAPPEAAAPVPNPFATPPPTAAVVPPPTPPPVVVARPPRPIRWRLDFGMGLGGTVVQDLGYRAFSQRRNLLAVEPSAIFDFRLAGGRFFLGGGVSYQYAQAIRYAYDSQLGNTVRLYEPRVIGRASFMIREGLDAFARVGVGPSIVDLDSSSEPNYDDYDYGYGGYESAAQRVVLPRVDGQAGMSLYLPKAWLPRKQASRVTAGLEFTLGYTWRGKLDYRPQLAQGDDPLRAITSPLGALSLHGLAWGIGLFLRVM